MRPRGKIISPQGQIGPKPQVGPPEPFFGPKVHPTQNGQKRPSGPKMSKSSMDTIFSVHGLWQPPEATNSALRKVSPHIEGKDTPSSMHPVLKVPGVVHIWYNIPLFTIFAQQSNGDTYRTQLCDSKTSPKSITNFEQGLFSYSVWKFPGGYQKTIQGPQPPGPAGVGLSIFIRTILRAILRGNQSF
ncbi:hypothetical protein O181_048842 [Austropuccinia psidii MF-1]|uniref:Uncharacterized protein n=1 Tax=Austropuccinia psidii MF-1 TaxID=1389203 RepID=A0A9Q3HM12_9BASI|nr:hypothetical protein [Austropuccinia psidii MF-1]